MTASRADTGPPVIIGGNEVAPGKHRRFDLPVARLPTGTWLSLPVSVVNGRFDGPMIWLSSTIHGDEINGIEIIRRVMKRLDARSLKGAVIAVPIVNVFGFINESRYLPDRRDLNRSFPGSPRGSLAARLAHLFITEIAQPCDIGLDFHTGSLHRTNLPQIRANLEDPETRRLSEAFGAPIMIHAKTRDGSLREVAARDGTKVLLFEGGEPQRFNEDVIEAGIAGTLRVMHELDMRDLEGDEEHASSVEATSSAWVRARRGGIFRLRVRLGEKVTAGQQIGFVSDAFGEKPVRIRSPFAGMVIGHTLDPLTSQGDGLVHIAELAEG